jgi:integrase/recombinase XerD
MNDPENRTRIDRVAIYRRGKKGTYCADYWHDGQHRRRSLKTSNIKIAKQRAAALEAEIGGGTHEPAVTDARIADAMELFLESLLSAGDAQGTLDTYRSALGIFRKSLEGLGIERLQRISVLAVDQYRSERKVTCELKTIYDNIKTIRRFLKWCVSRRLLRKNPLDEYKVKKPVPEPKGGPSLMQIAQILETAAEPVKSAFMTLAYTGMRPRELRNIRREDIDLVGNWIYIRSRKGAETKTRRSRKVPIHVRLMPVLRALQPRSRTWFFGKSASGAGIDFQLDIQKLNEEFKGVLTGLKISAGRKNGGYTLRSLRNSFETVTVNQRIPQRVIDAWLGHNEDKSMAAVYYRLTDQESQEFMREVRFDADETKADVGGVEIVRLP